MANTPSSLQPPDYSTQWPPFSITGSTSANALVEVRGPNGLLLPATANPVVANGSGAFTIASITSLTGNHGACYVSAGGMVSAAGTTNLLDRGGGRKAWYFQGGSGTTLALSGMDIPQNSLLGVCILSKGDTPPTPTACYLTIGPNGNDVTVQNAINPVNDIENGGSVKTLTAIGLRYSATSAINPSAAWSNASGTITVDTSQDYIAALIAVCPVSTNAYLSPGADSSSRATDMTSLDSVKMAHYFAASSPPTYVDDWLVGLGMISLCTGTGAISQTLGANATYPPDAGWLSQAASDRVFVLFDKLQANPIYLTWYRAHIDNSPRVDWILGQLRFYW